MGGVAVFEALTGPLLSELGTNKTVETRFCPWRETLSGKGV